MAMYIVHKETMLRDFQHFFDPKIPPGPNTYEHAKSVLRKFLFS